MNKQVIAIFFSLLMLCNSAGLLCYYCGQIELHKIKMLQYMANTKKFDPALLSVFSGSNKEVELENDHELNYRGNMYDIIKTEKKGNDILYYALSDSKEDALLSSMAEQANNDSANGVPQGKKVSFETLNFIRNNNDLSFNLHLLNMHADWFIGSLDYYPSPLKTVITPPPQIVTPCFYPVA